MPRLAHRIGQTGNGWEIKVLHVVCVTCQAKGLLLLYLQSTTIEGMFIKSLYHTIISEWGAVTTMKAVKDIELKRSSPHADPVHTDMITSAAPRSTPSSVTDSPPITSTSPTS